MTEHLRAKEREALEIIEAAEREAELLIALAVQRNEGYPGPLGLDTGGVRFAEEAALQVIQQGKVVATCMLYGAYADLEMMQASTEAAFIISLDTVFEKLAEALKGRTARHQAQDLRQKWCNIASERSVAGWFVAKPDGRNNTQALITNQAFWSDLERRFRDLGSEFGDHFTALWISFDWSDRGEQWALSATQSRERERFQALAERCALGLGCPPGDGGLFVWLDRLKSESPNFRGAYQCTDTHGRVSYWGGVIRRPCEASADYCFKLETKGVASTYALDLLHQERDAENKQPPSRWEDVEIEVLSDERVQIRTGDPFGQATNSKHGTMQKWVSGTGGLESRISNGQCCWR